MSAFPRPITSIHQVEISSRCNLRCVYCPSRNLDKPRSEGGHGRAKIDITDRHYARALEWARHFDRKGTQGELALTGIGEALLHPRFVEYVRLAREALPESPITFSTNGILLTDDLCRRLSPYRPEIFVSLHRPERAKPAIDAARRWGLLKDVNDKFATDAFDWAGQVDWPTQIAAGAVTCDYLRKGWSVVLADGRITTCCLDASGDGSVGHVDDRPGSLSMGPWGLCGPCHMDVPSDAEVLAA